MTGKLRLSQNHLHLLETCPRKFQETYLDGLVSPITWEEDENMAWGSRFHLLMQQGELGLPIQGFMAEDRELQNCFLALVKAAPEVFSPQNNYSSGEFREAEHYRTLGFGDYVLVAIYDLLTATKNEAKIIDWKTNKRLVNRQKLADNWQTRLYLYLLVETSDYPPEQVSMTYWFVRLRGDEKPQKITFVYDQQQHEKNYRDLTKLCDRLSDYLHQYQRGEPFPLVAS
ncbi:MAG: PD-(D/E)XK nuclease family protein [Arthrospira sp. PLM2.Bin9]|nr:PD-(D/E)XK nuclease family protein [Arthrospira sp. PLM2.Bin9]TVU53673.1 MAG: PD-(D/E)XK nuclease family protein [Arthrospira sp. PLM2.Bin9]